MTGVKSAIARVRTRHPGDAELATLATELAAGLLDEANRRRRWAERAQGRRLAAMMGDPVGKAFTIAFADQVFRPPEATRQARRLRDLLDDYGAPRYLGTSARTLLTLGGLASRVAPNLVMSRIEQGFRQQSAAVILPADPARLHRHVVRRRRGGLHLNLNQLGEAVLGEEEAARRLQANLERLADPDCDYLSVKLSAIYSQIHAIAFDESLAPIKERLRQLYRAALQHRRPNGQPKFVNLDMEEYHDLGLTCEAFREVLGEHEFHGLEAGIVLQAYLPDAWAAQRELNRWARQRVSAGGAGIKIRLVKGANLAMERVEAEMHGWPLAPYGSKQEVDANFKRMLHEACRPENAAVVRLGVASHNLFDVAYALLLREREGVAARVGFEMLEGMANHQGRVLRDRAGDLLLYAPVVKRKDFPSAIAYLVRRLDENTSPENFLHDLFGMRTGDAAWVRQKQRFLAACATKDSVRATPSRTQNRAIEKARPQRLEEPFDNVADTDWSLPANRRWIRDWIGAMRSRVIPRIPLHVGGRAVGGSATGTARDPSRPGQAICEYALAGREDVVLAVVAARAARASWAGRTPAGRGRILTEAGAEIQAMRGEAIALMVCEAGKSASEADAEVSEAVDFANYYARSLLDPGWHDGTGFEPLGTVVVAPPWNFPLAIPAGGVLAALAAGNTVILKPAPESVLTAWTLAGALWRAGVPPEVLQFLPCPDDDVGRSLVTADAVDAVVLTGAFSTARKFLEWKPRMRLLAETSGKNAMVITAAADPDLAVRDLVRSAFGHAGQKCSAASLAIVEAALYDDPGFRRRLKDAAGSLKTGPAWELDSVVTPLIREPGESLARALGSLDAGEEWLLEPRMHDGNPSLWSPGIKLGVRPDGWFRRTECFGPVLGLIRARDLDHAIRLQNDSGFGLTGGLCSLDPAEIREWQARVEVGNAYVNRGITGAIVRRQPFGGWKGSCFGPGAKAGGPNYVAQFARWSDTREPQRVAAPRARLQELAERAGGRELVAAAGSDAYWMVHEFGADHDPAGLRPESNRFRYRPFHRALIRSGGSHLKTARMVLAAMAAGVDFELSVDPGDEVPAWMADWIIWREDEAGLARRLGSADYEIVRAPGCGEALVRATIGTGIRLVSSEPVMNGRIEILPFLREQTLAETLHRHGSVLPTRNELP